MYLFRLDTLGLSGNLGWLPSAQAGTPSVWRWVPTVQVCWDQTGFQTCLVSPQGPWLSKVKQHKRLGVAERHKLIHHVVQAERLGRPRWNACLCYRILGGYKLSIWGQSQTEGVEPGNLFVWICAISSAVSRKDCKQKIYVSKIRHTTRRPFHLGEKKLLALPWFKAHMKKNILRS